MAITPGGSLNSVPASMAQTLSSNYIDFTATATAGWAQQYLPDLMEKEAEVFGNRTISGFLAQVGAEESMTSDQVVWSEQGRLHLSYKGKTASGTTVLIQGDIDEAKFNASGISTASGGGHGVRVNDTIIIANSVEVVKALVVSISTDTLTVAPYGATSISHTTGTNADRDCRILVYGSEFGKGKTYGNPTAGATDSRGANEPTFQSFTNKPIIMKDYYEISGSDASRIGWVEVTGEDGQNGYLWYLKAEGDTRSRFTDYIEMAMIEGITGLDSDAATNADVEVNGNGNSFGTEGLFAAIEARGNMSSGITGFSASTDLDEFDAILAEFDKQGAIEENMMFVNRATSLAIDDMLASMNSHGAGGTSFGVFDNSEDMALNLGFSGFRRGSYDFYKSDFRYLNDLATRGAINDINAAAAIRGVIIPAGVSSVYDQLLGKNLKRPFLHVRYRASQTDDRRLKTWVTGSVGATTSALDAMQVHMLTERCLITQGANNFMLLN
tara:strand:+ start:297 stop:1790 length:1494 start_codon:yes stop_codon:yes gene_type:complete